MKTLLSAIMGTIVLLSSCGNKQINERFIESQNKIEESHENSIDNNNSIMPKNCDEFINQYKNWMDNYLVIIEKYINNPMDDTILQEYMKLTGESLNWICLWNSKFGSCTSKEQYNVQFNKITKKAEKKLQSIVLD